MIEKKFLNFALYTELSDLIFEHHMKSYMGLNIIIISIQFIALFISIFTQIFWDLSFSKYLMVVNIVLCAIVVINNILHNLTWKKAKERAEKIYAGIDYLCSESETESELKYRRFMQLLVPTGYHGKHMANSSKK